MTSPFHDEQATQPSLWTYGAPRAAEAEKQVNVKQLRERLQLSGPSLLSTAELVAIVFGTGPSPPRVLHQIQTLCTDKHLPELLRLDFGDLRQHYSLGEAKAVQLHAVLELARRLTLSSTTQQYHIRCP